ncbi:protein of unknown function [Methylotuvimicrobium alcaliphilum 20Z]|uniref:Uncharacterized protein n=1 Tax=Methylotuvimicrobium alcaliphilum (strain DSM 19304 / NCIMB 14124 / VKM B-2133 / 20Z) TaxID=1091494 RepID=G4T0G8_META2|nr:protein of unknown function [Methylotuvimicrobium alcaliphilum 20Z]
MLTNLFTKRSVPNLDRSRVVGILKRKTFVFMSIRFYTRRSSKFGAWVSAKGRREPST